MTKERTPSFGDDGGRGDLVASRDEPAQFSTLFDLYYVSLYRYLARRVGIDHAEDLTSITYADAFRNRLRYNPELATPRAWLFGIATTHVLRHRRGEGRRIQAHERLSPPVQPEPATDTLITHLDESVRLDAALALITTELREVVLLIALVELSYDECAAALDIPVGTVRSRLFRARRELRSLLEGPPMDQFTLRLVAEGNTP